MYKYTENFVFSKLENIKVEEVKNITAKKRKIFLVKNKY